MARSVLSNASSILIAVLFAIIVWIVATNEENPVREGLFPDALPISFENRAEGLTLLEPSRLAGRARIRTETSTWNNLNSSNFELVADLGGLGAGEHQVALNARSTDPSVRVLSVDPPTVSVRLEPIREVQLPVRVRIADEPPLGYETGTPEVTPGSVTITGPASEIDRVNDAAVEVAIRGAKSAVDREASVILLDAQGNAIPNVRAEPATVLVRLPIDQRVGYKDAAVKAVIRGTPASGYWVSDISVEPSTVTLVGAPQVLEELAGFIETDDLDISGAQDNVVERVRIKLPEGVSVLNVNDVAMRVAVEPVLSGLTVRRAADLSDGCSLSATVSPDTVEVILSGPLPKLQALTPEDVQIVIDAPRCQPGSFQGTLRALNVPDSISVQSIVPSTAEVTIDDVNP